MRQTVRQACAAVLTSVEQWAEWCGRKYGRKKTMLIAGLLFDLGVAITCAAFNLAMLIIGRILLGIAVAFASVAVTLYNSEMAPAHIRGRLNQIFQVGPQPSLAVSPSLHATPLGLIAGQGNLD